jgi:DNA-directed RNA polymerase subunit RPC12/RpoP
MKSLNHFCEDCESEFTIRYDEIKTEDDPRYCPFCSSYILDSEYEDNDDEDYD